LHYIPLCSLYPRNIALLANPLHPKALSVATTLTSLLQQKNIEYTLFTTQWPSHWTDFTEAWIVGGDGTLNYFINHYPQIDLAAGRFQRWHWQRFSLAALRQYFHYTTSRISLERNTATG
jgi:hypothetical protein